MYVFFFFFRKRTTQKEINWSISNPKIPVFHAFVAEEHYNIDLPLQNAAPLPIIIITRKSPQSFRFRTMCSRPSACPIQWRSQGLPGWANRPPGEPNWGRKSGKIIEEKWEKIIGEWWKMRKCPSLAHPGLRVLLRHWPHQHYIVHSPQSTGSRTLWSKKQLRLSILPRDINTEAVAGLELTTLMV